MNTIDLDKYALDIAKKHLLEKVSFKELGKVYYTSPSTIQRRLMKWLSDKRFELHDKTISESPVIISIDDGLGEELARKTGIWRARVVRIIGLEVSNHESEIMKTGNSDLDTTFEESDELHRCLGKVAAELVIGSLRRNMTMGISSGRGVGFTIDGMKEIAGKTPSWFSGYESIRLVSLCGGTHVGKWQYSSVRDFDADENVFALSSLLKSPRHNVYYITGPISMDSGSHSSKINPKFNIDIAVIGLSQLNSQHHYFRDYKDLQLKKLSESINKIIEWQSRNPELLDSVAEIVLRLYPATNKAVPPELLDIIRETNNHVLAVNPGKIKNAGEVVLVAGGVQKVNVLRGILAGDFAETPIDKRNLTLITDSRTAEEILTK